MNSPYPPNENPDRRPLPPGWITQYDSNYRAWFYVNERASPPVTTWEHPAQHASPPPNAYGPPSGPPPGPGSAPGYGYDNRQGSYSGYGGSGYQPSPPPQQYYNTPPPQRYSPNPGYNPEENRGFFGGGRPSSNPPPQQVVYEQAAPPPKKHGMGMGTMVGVGAAGLIGGALIGEMVEHHEDEERFDAYEQGVDQGRMDDFGGGGFGGGGFDDFGDGGGGW